LFWRYFSAPGTWEKAWPLFDAAEKARSTGQNKKSLASGVFFVNIYLLVPDYLRFFGRLEYDVFSFMKLVLAMEISQIIYRSR